jgi:hypothetical protein
MSSNDFHSQMEGFMLSNAGDLNKVVNAWRKHEFTPPFLKVAKTRFQKILGRPLTKEEYYVFYRELLLTNHQIRIKLQEMEHIRSEGPLSYKTDKENSICAWFVREGDEGIKHLYMSELVNTFYLLSISL